MKVIRTLLVAAAVWSCQSFALSETNKTLSLVNTLEDEKSITNVYRAYYPSEELANKAAITFHSQIMETHKSKGYLILELSEDDIKTLKSFNFTIQPAKQFIKQRDERLSAIQKQLLQMSSQGNDISFQSIPGYECYETVEETFAVADSMVANFPNLASFVDVGDSWEKTQSLGGYDIKVLQLTNKSNTFEKPKLFINSAIHAREYTTAPLNLEFARWLTNGYGTNADATWILDHHEVHLMLQANPDGRKKAEAGSSWRKNTNQNFCGATSSSRGVDLNRNFTDRWNITNGQGSSGNQCSLTYRGPSPGSEPEIQALEAYVRNLFPDNRGPNDNDAAPLTTSGMHLDIHSYSELVLWPWGDKSSAAPNGTQLQTLGRKFAYFNGYNPQQSIGLYPTDGTSDNVSYSELGVPAFTFELGTSFFQGCSTYNNTIKPDNLKALVYAAKVVRAPYVTPAGPDVTSLSLSDDASGAGVPAGTAVTISGAISDLRFSTRNGTESTQNINAVEYYIDTPPWQSGATPVAMSASDGAFNSKTESFTGAINTTGLSVGQHIVYVQGKDTTNTFGAVTAVFLNITDGQPPALDANFTFDCSQLSCNFDASSSVGNISNYSWSFGDGNSGSGQNVSHTFGSAGEYSVALTVSNNQNESDTLSQTVTVSSAADNELLNGIPVTGISDSQGGEIRFVMNVPENSVNLSFVISGGSGDADLYVRYGQEPTTSQYDCRPYRNGNSETCSFSAPQAGTYYVMLRAYRGYSGVSLTGSYSEGGTGGSFERSGLSDSSGGWQHFPVEIPAGMTTFVIQMSGGSGDADLYVRRGAQSTTSNYDCRPYRWGNSESCSFNSPAAGTWYISVRAYSTYSGVNVSATWNP